MSQGESKFVVIITCKTKTLNDETLQNDILNSISHEQILYDKCSVRKVLILVHLIL
jgi:hypothetical protein